MSRRRIVDDGRWVPRHELKRLAKLYAGSILVQNEAPDDSGPLADAVREELRLIGERLVESSGFEAQITWAGCRREWLRGFVARMKTAARFRGGVAR